MSELKLSGSDGTPRLPVLPHLFASLLLFACVAPRREPQPVVIEAVNGSSPLMLRLVAAPGVRINARLKPALELNDGRNIRFDASGVTPDSAYFAESPRAALSGGRESVAGMLRVSVCPAAASYCQTLELPVTPSTITWQLGANQR